MFKKSIALFACVFLLVNICGCVALLAGAAGGVGTAGWLSGKLTQELNASFDRTLKATASALNSLKLEITKQTIKDDVAQVMAKYTDERTVWVDIHRVSNNISRVEVRVGFKGDEEASRKILSKIKRYL